MTTPRPRRGIWLVFALLIALGIVAVLLKQDAPTLASILVVVAITGLVGWLIWVTRRNSAAGAHKGARATPADVWGPEMRADRRRAEREALKGQPLGGPAQSWRSHVPDNWPLRSDDPPTSDRQT